MRHLCLRLNHHPHHLVQVVPGMCRVLEVVRVGAILSGKRVTLLRADTAILCRISIFELTLVGKILVR